MDLHYFAPIKIIQELKSILKGGNLCITTTLLEYTHGGKVIIYLVPLLGAYLSTKKAITGYINSIRQEFLIEKVDVSFSLVKPSKVLTGK